MVAGSLVAVFGGTGFIGCHLVQRLAKAGARVRVVARDPEAGMFLKTMGEPGQIILGRGNLLDAGSASPWRVHKLRTCSPGGDIMGAAP